MEAAAYGIQRTISDEMDSKLSNAIHERMYHDVDLHRDGGSVTPKPYNIVDLLISRRVRELGGKEYDRATLLKLTDHALMHAYAWVPRRPIAGEGVNLGKRLAAIAIQPGAYFVEALMGLSETEIRTGEFDLEPKEDFVRQYKSEMTSKKKWSPSEHPLYAAVEAIERNVRERVVLPLLDKRLENKEILSDIAQYLDAYLNLPKPLVFVRLESHLSEVDITADGQEFTQTWTLYSFLCDILDQLLGGATIIECPRKRSQLLQGLNCVKGNSCSKLLFLKKCGYWDLNPDRSLPPCAFRYTIASLGMMLEGNDEPCK